MTFVLDQVYACILCLCIITVLSFGVEISAVCRPATRYFSFLKRGMACLLSDFTGFAAPEQLIVGLALSSRAVNRGLLNCSTRATPIVREIWGLPSLVMTEPIRLIGRAH